MTQRIRRYVGFQISTAFPANSVVARFVTRLCVVTNDIMLTQENTGVEYQRSDGHREGVPLYYLYTAGSHFREAVKLLATDLEVPEIAAFVSALDSDARDCLDRLRASFTPWAGSFVETRLKPIRDQTFHYPSDTDVEEALTRAASLHSGVNLGAGTYVETRYDFADQVVTSLAAESLGTNHAEMKQTLERFASLMLDYVHFTHAAVTHYLKSLPASALQLQEITVT